MSRQMKWLRTGLILLLATALLSGGLAVAKKPVPEPEPEPDPPPFTYDVEFLGVPAGHVEGYTQGMNDLGEVVGFSYIDSERPYARAFVSYVVEGIRVTVDLNTLVDGDAEDHPFPPGYVLNEANDINNAGQITGLAQDPTLVGTSARAFRFSLATGLLEDLGTVNGNRTKGLGINELGDVMGVYKDADDNQYAFLYTDSDGMIDLGGFGGNEVWPEGINKFGQVTGYVYGSPDSAVQGFLYSPSMPTPTESPIIDGSAELTHPNGINDLGQVVGWGVVTVQINKNKTETIKRAMLYDSVTGEIKDFANPPDTLWNNMYEINSSEEIVGYGWGIDTFPYIYFNDIDKGWHLNEMAGVELEIYNQEYLHINNNAQIVFMSSLFGLPEPALLTPVYAEP